MIDFHVHTDASFDCETPVDAVCQSAIAAGLSGLCITDHVEMVDDEAHIRAAAEASLKNCRRAQEQYGHRMQVFTGIELGEPLYNLPLCNDIVSKGQYDFVLVSIHRLGEEPDYYFQDFAPPSGISQADWIQRELARYFDEVLRTVQWGKFHALAHLTYPFRYLPADYRYDYRFWQDQIDAILSEMARRGLALEINTAGLRTPMGLTQPDWPIIQRFRELGGEYVTFGSDAHLPQQVGAGLEEAARLARQAGLRPYPIQNRSNL